MRGRIFLFLLVVAGCATGQLYTGEDSGTPENDSSTASDVTKPPGDSGKDSAATCTAPDFMCAEAGCVDLSNDPDHCGQCNTACDVADGGGLEAGNDYNPDAGIPPSDAAPPDGAPWTLGSPTCTNKACAVTCPGSDTLCTDGVCYDTQRFHDHCGSCATACQATEYCTTGHCCATGTAWCGSSCVSVLSDPSNCGACGSKCQTNYSCVNGACTSCSNVNEAPSATATSSGGGSTTYGPADMNDGTLETTSCTYFEWTSAGSTPGTAWVQYTWGSAKKLTKMHIDTTTTVNNTCGYGRTVGGASVQWWNGTAWVTDGTVSGQTNDWDYTFTSPVTTTQVRLYGIYAAPTSTTPSNPIIYEWQVTGCN